MKFKGTGIVWDGENNKALIEFVNGICESTDDRVIKILKDNGFQEFNESETQKADEDSDVEGTKESWNEIKRKATSLGISIRGKKKDELLELIKEK